MRIKKREEVTPQVIFEDRDLLVINKPSGWIVNDATTTNGQPTVQYWLKKNFEYPVANVGHLRSGIAHRLDKETTGVLLVAKTKEYFEYLQKLFKERKVEKSYVALLHGRLETKEGIVEAEVGRLPWNKRRFGVLPGGRHSKTRYKVQEYFKKGGVWFSLVDFYPETGRTHQIRIHAKHIGHPIVGDEFYAGRKTSRRDRVWCPRLFLHAKCISFKKLNGYTVEYTSQLPGELQDVLDVLEKVTASK